MPSPLTEQPATNPGAPAQLVEWIRSRGFGVRILVNNAGHGVSGRYLARDWDTHAAFLLPCCYG